MAEPFLPATLEVPDQAAAARVLVRPFTRGDAVPLRAAIEESRQHIRPWLPWWNGHQRIEETVDFCVKSSSKWATRESFGGGIFLRADGSFLGGAGLHVRSWEARGFEIGYWVRVSAAGRGYVREATAALTRLAFESLDANRVMIRCDAENTRSARVAESLGYSFEGRLRRDSRTPDGELRDTLFFSILREEYQARLPDWRPLLEPAP